MLKTVLAIERITRRTGFIRLGPNVLRQENGRRINLFVV